MNPQLYEKNKNQFTIGSFSLIPGKNNKKIKEHIQESIENPFDN